MAPDVVSDDDEHVPQRRDDFETKYLKDLMMNLDDMMEGKVDGLSREYMKIGLELKILEQLNALNATMTNLLEEFRKLARLVSA